MEMLLRWTIGLGATAGLAMFALIMLVGRGIAMSYRAGSGVEDLSRDLLTAGIPLLLILMIVGVLRPDWRMVQYFAGTLAALALVGCFWVMQTNPGEGILYSGFLILWLIYCSTKVFA